MQFSISCFTHLLQGSILGSWSSYSTNKKRFLLRTDWFTKTSFSFSKYIFYEKLWPLSQDLFFSQNRARDSFLFDTCFSRTDSEQLEEFFKKSGEVFVLENMGYKNLLQFRKMCHGWGDKGSVPRAIFRDPKPKNRETCSLISRVCLQQSDDHVGGFIKFDFLRFQVVK